MLEMIMLMFGSVLLVCGMIGLITIVVGVMVLTKLWNRYRISDRIRETYWRIRWYISGRGFGS